MAKQDPKEIKQLLSAKKRKPVVAPRPYLEVALEIAATIPEESLALLPKDFSKNVKHYLYGHPKQA